MAITIPTTAEIAAQNITNFEVRIGQTIPINDRAFVRVLAAIEAGLSTMHNKYAADRLLQNLALTATGSDLDRIGINYRVYRKAAIAWVGVINQPAVNGTVIPVTVDYISDASGIHYLVNAAATAGGGLGANVSVTSTEPGTNGNLSGSDTLTIGRQISGITSTTANYVSTNTTGVDRESDTEYRRRILQEIRTVGGGGNSADYRTWAEEVTGVARVFPFSGAPVGSSHKLRDPDMETVGVAYWTAGTATTVVTKQTGTPHGGTRCLRVADSGVAVPYAYQSALDIGREYTIAGWARGDTGRAPAVFDGAVQLWAGTIAATWQNFSAAFTATSNQIQFWSLMGGAGYCEFDDLALTVTDSLPGDRVVYVEATTAIHADGIPTEALLSSVRTDLNTDPDTGEDRMPLGLTDAKLFVEPIIRHELDAEITGLVVDAAQEVACKISLTDGVDEYFRSVSPYVDGLDSELDRNDVITGVSLAETIQGVLTAYGASAESITFELSGAAPTTRYTLAENETVKLGTITYV